MATLAELQKNAPGWLWVHCNGPCCSHKAPVPLAPLIIRWGPTATIEMIQRSFLCDACGVKGAHTTTPSWGNMVTGWRAFPADQVTVFSRPTSSRPFPFRSERAIAGTPAISP
ncbi:MAG: hypothetical protein AB7U62_11340 [Pseudolabrys sp.]